MILDGVKRKSMQKDPNFFVLVKNVEEGDDVVVFFGVFCDGVCVVFFCIVVVVAFCIVFCVDVFVFCIACVGVFFCSA